MFFWFLGGAFLIVWLVFRDPAFDYRLLLIRVLLPDVVDALLGGARVLHSLAFSVGLLAVVMLATIGHRALRRQLIALPIGTFLHLVLDAAWADADVFWWPFSGVGYEAIRRCPAGKRAVEPCAGADRPRDPRVGMAAVRDGRRGGGACSCKRAGSIAHWPSREAPERTRCAQLSPC